jgi:hypothetical protein
MDGVRAALVLQPPSRPDCFLVSQVWMKRQSVITRKKKKRGPAPTGKGELLGVRIHPPQLAALDNWISRQADSPSRPEAIRRILEQTLAGPSARPTSRRKAQKASELADRAAEHLVDKSMPPEEQQLRKRTLIKGPKEFREIREDQPKLKRE